MNNGFYSKAKRCLDKDDYGQAKKLFEDGLIQNDVRCLYGLLALNAIQGNDITAFAERLSNRFDELHILFDNGDGDAAFIIGRCYEMGIAVPREMHSAIRYYIIAKDRGNSDAMFNLGCIYLSQGIDESKIAKDYFEPAADLNNPNACFALGFYYESAENTNLAMNYYCKAAKHGNAKMREKYAIFLQSTNN